MAKKKEIGKWDFVDFVLSLNPVYVAGKGIARDFLNKRLAENVTPDAYAHNESLFWKTRELIHGPSENSKVDKFSNELWKHFNNQENDLDISESGVVSIPDSLKLDIVSYYKNGISKKRINKIRRDVEIAQRDVDESKKNNLEKNGIEYADSYLDDKLKINKERLEYALEADSLINRAKSGKHTVFNEYNIYPEKYGVGDDDMTKLAGLGSFTIYTGEDGKGHIKDTYDFYRKDQQNITKIATSLLDKIGYPFDIEDSFEYANGGEVLEYEDQAYDYLTSKRKLNPRQAIAIMANIKAESGFNPNIQNSIGAYGYQQWLGPRKEALIKKYGPTPTPEQQLEFLVDEHEGLIPGSGWNYKTKGKTLNDNRFKYYMYSKSEFDEAPTTKDAVIAWNQGFGRPATHELNNKKRLEYAEDYLRRFGINDDAISSYHQEGYRYQYPTTPFEITINAPHPQTSESQSSPKTSKSVASSTDEDEDMKKKNYLASVIMNEVTKRNQEREFVASLVRNIRLRRNKK